MARSDGSAPRRPGPRTRAVHGPVGPVGPGGPAKPAGSGSTAPAAGRPVSTPILHSATFTFPDLDAMRAAQDAGAGGAFYQRYGHPTLRACEERLADLEGAEMGLLFSSGMAAISAVFLAC